QLLLHSFAYREPTPGEGVLKVAEHTGGEHGKLFAGARDGVVGEPHHLGRERHGHLASGGLAVQAAHDPRLDGVRDPFRQRDDEIDKARGVRAAVEYVDEQEVEVQLVAVGQFFDEVEK